MIKRDEYVLKWLDHTVHFSLNPTNNQMGLSMSDLQSIRQRVLVEANDQIVFLYKGALSLLSQKKIKVFINQYHQALIFLLDQSNVNLQTIDTSQTDLIACCQAVTACIEHILEHVRNRFANFFLVNRPISEKHCIQLKKEIKSRTDILNVRFKDANVDTPLTEILWKVLYEFSEASNLPIYYNKTVYIQGLIGQLEKIEIHSDSQTLHHRLVHLLLQHNFNDQRFMSYYSQHIGEQVHISKNQKMQILLLHRKQFFQIIAKSGLSLYPEAPSLRKSIGNWFKQEINYLAKLGPDHISPQQSGLSLVKDPENKIPQKIICLMSADQIGIILHSLDALRIVQAKSMSAVFESIVPSLSTMQKNDLSWKSMRSKSYVFEDNDRNSVIAILQSMIKFIEEY